VNPAQVDRRIEQLSAAIQVPILRLWEPKTLDTPPVRRGRHLDAPDVPMSERR